MSSFIESAAALMSNAARQLDVVAHNVANVTTPGYKRRIAFHSVLSNTGTLSQEAPEVAEVRSMVQGKIVKTDNPLDLAIDGEGFLQVRCGDDLLYTRQGQFAQTVEGLLVTPQGYILQQAGGGDLRAEDGATFAPDGTLMVDGRTLGRAALVRPSDPAMLEDAGESFFRIAGGATWDEVTDATVRGGMVEASNIDLGQEMTQTMLILRQAENGARLVQLYDDLMGRAVTAFGQGGGR
ncbi:flagellar hook basal-body protein [uncultured Sphingomonas sp.]|uniref:flagellar hook-basal body protein n=1 Tax=uncultured Sphingomonas sp. TaxID=158754 RepID=UPI0025D53E0F|nr:flagellar hook basal-body protein [uncultured Sphingomonas sp.]